MANDFTRLIRDTGQTPLSSGVQTYSNPLPDALNNLATDVGNRAKKILVDNAASAGARDGDAGQIKKITPITDMDWAYKNAAETAFYARSTQDIQDAIQSGIEQFSLDPDGFSNFIQSAKSKAIKDTSPDFAVRLNQLWDKNASRALYKIQDQKRSYDAKIHVDDVNAKIKTLSDMLEGYAQKGELNSQDAIDVMSDMNELQKQRLQNPLFKYGEGEYVRDSSLLQSKLTALSVGHTISKEFDDAINAGMNINEAEAYAYNKFKTEFETNESLKNLSVIDKARIQGFADNALQTNIKIAKEEKAADDDKKREEERALREKQKANYDDNWYAADNGSLSYAQISAMEAKGEINGAQARSLISSLRAGQSRRRTEARMAAAAERTAAAAEKSAQRTSGKGIYYDLYDLADTDPDTAIAQARVMRSNGHISEAQYRSINSHARAENNSDDQFRKKDLRNFLSGYGESSSGLSNAYDHYQRWIDKNPNATAKERDKWMSDFKTSYSKIKSSGPNQQMPKSNNGTLNSKRTEYQQKKQYYNNLKNKQQSGGNKQDNKVFD